MNKQTRIEKYIEEHYLILEDDFSKQEKKLSTPEKEEEDFQDFVWSRYCQDGKE